MNRLTPWAFPVLFVASVLASGCAASQAADAAEGENALATGETTPAAAKTLACSTAKTGVNDWTFKLDATLVSATELGNVRVQAIDSVGPEIGRADRQVANPDYKPTKYTDSNQFKLALTDAKTGGTYSPLNKCWEMEVLLPKTVDALASGAKFTGRFMYHCEQDGSSVPFFCSVN